MEAFSNCYILEPIFVLCHYQEAKTSFKCCLRLNCLLLYLFESSAESLKHSLHVASLLHGDDPGMVLLIHPDQEGLLIVVPEGNQLKELNKELSV